MRIVIKHDNLSDILKGIRQFKSIKSMEIAAKQKGLFVSISKNKDWIAIAETKTSEDIFIAELIN